MSLDKEKALMILDDIIKGNPSTNLPISYHAKAFISGKVGEVISDRLEIACSNNQSIKILEIQRQGKKPQKIREFMLGSQIKKGSIIPNV